MQDQGLTHAGAEQKQAHNDGALAGPERVAIEVLPYPAEVIQIEGEMKTSHPDDGEAAQGVKALLPGCA